MAKTDMQKLRDRALIRDRSRCRLMKVLSVKEVFLLQKMAPVSRLKKLDLAHVIPRGESKKLSLELDNVVMLNNYSHLLLDYLKHPITGHPITRDEQKEWWERIVGKTHYEKLKDLVD
jgi:predicted nucleotidyltransferase